MIDGEIKSGLLVTDVSDHLPVFTVLDINNKFKVKTNKQTNNWAGVKSPEAITAFKAERLSHDWQEVYVDYIMNFICIFEFNDQYCPFKEYRQNHKDREKPWLTKGLEKACKKKNRLYRHFIKH